MRKKISAVVLAVGALALVLGAGSAFAARFSKEKEFGTSGTGAGQFEGPRGVAVETGTGDVLVVDQKNNRVEKWEREADGAYRQIGEITYGEFKGPSAVAVDNSSGATKGYVYVVSGNTSGNGGATVDEFKPKGSSGNEPNEYELVTRIEAPSGEAKSGAVAVDPTTGDVGIVGGDFVGVYKPSGEVLVEEVREAGATVPVTGLVLDDYQAFVTTSGFGTHGALERWVLSKKYELTERTVLFEEATANEPKLTGVALGAGDAYVDVESSAGKSYVDVFSGVETASGAIAPVEAEIGTGQIGASSGIGWSSQAGAEYLYVANTTSNTVLVLGPPPMLPLTVDLYGEGTVTSSPAGIDCLSTDVECTASFAEGATVTLEEKATSGYAFAGWIGCKRDASKPTQCTVTLNAATEVSAAFVKEGAQGTSGEGVTTKAFSGKEHGCEDGGIEVTSSGGAKVEYVCDGSNGKEGPAGAQGPAGTAGKQGPAGATGATGATGAAGAAGPQGKEGPAGKVELVTCKAAKGKGKKAQACTTKVVSGTAKFRVSGVSARLRDGRRLVASGTVRRSGATTQLLLSVTRAVPKGTYTLAWGTMRGGATAIHRERLRLP